MPKHAEKRVLPYAPEQLFDLVAAVECYPEFLPWCLSTRILKRQDNVFYNDMTIGFRLYRERFLSKVELDRPRRIDVTFVEGPFRHLVNHWVFTPVGEGACEIDFYVDFEFRSRILQKVIGVLFGEAVRHMVRAFEGRAEALYGSPPPEALAEMPKGA